MTTCLRASLVALVVFINGCLAPEIFSCRSDAECVKDGAQGSCSLGSCAFADASCATGFRWDKTARARASECVCSADFSSDPENCGGCGKTCLPLNNGAGACVAGACTITACPVGYLDCDEKYDNGCEANVTNSNMQVSSEIDACGTCGLRCPLTAHAAATVCQASACKLTSCSGIYRDCDEQYDNGCECDSGVCSGSICVPWSCNDGVKNGTEIDLDCGGENTCPRCPVGKHCLNSSDCQTGYCNSAKTCAPFCDSCGTARCCGGYSCAGRGQPGDFCFHDEDCASCSCYHSPMAFT